jgi:uracil-DNA glycosylase family 4
MRVGKARLVLIAEAPGFRGAKFSGIAMTSERILMDHQPKVPSSAVFDGEKSRTSLEALMPLGFIEPTASITWSLLLSLGLKPSEFVLWNSFPCHPFKGTNPLTNRAPTPAELASCAHVLPLMLELFDTAQVVAVGRVAQRALASLGLEVPNVRHPAMGGATAFRSQIMELLSASAKRNAPVESS